MSAAQKSRAPLSLNNSHAPGNDELSLLQERNLELYITLQKVHEAVMNHKLNCKLATASDVALWETVDSLIEVK